MNKTEKIVHLAGQYLLPTYSRAPIVFQKGKGVYLWDVEGKKYIDMLAGVAVDNLGHAHPRIVKVLSDQIKKLSHTSNIFQNDLQAKLAEKLIHLSGLNKAFFCNSGAEAIEACIKFARHYAFAHGFKDRYEIITMEHSFHGRTMGAISATGQPKYQQGFGPLLPGFKTIPYNNLNALKEAIKPSTIAVMLEPLQGEGGVNIPAIGYLKNVEKICRENKLLLILDEVQTGVGRTGSFFNYTQDFIQPDLVAMAKGLGSGFPIGACLASARISEIIKPGLHASTFGGNHLASRVALETTHCISSKSFLKKVESAGMLLLKELNQLKNQFALIKEVRGRGLMVGCELNEPIGAQIVTKCLEKGLVINCLHDTVLRFVPPLVISQKEIKQAMKILQSVFEGLNNVS